MNRDQRMSRGVVVIGGLLCASSSLSASTISWVSSAAVPMGTTSLLLMSLLFMLAGAWLLSKYRRQAPALLAVPLLLSGLYGISAVANGSNLITITDGTIPGSATLATGDNSVTNNSGISVRISAITITPEHFSVEPEPEPRCEVDMILAPGESCYLYLIPSQPI